MNKSILISAFAVVLALGCQTTKSKQVSNPCLSLKDDLAFIHAELKENSANYNYDEKSVSETEQRYRTLQDDITKCRTTTDYISTIKKYFSFYNDPHLKVRRSSIEIPTFTTGILIRRMNEKYFVWMVDTNQKTVLPGDQQLACDGLNADAILNDKILPYEGINEPDVFKNINAYRIFIGGT
jgi:hypothetical protein